MTARLDAHAGTEADQEAAWSGHDLALLASREAFMQAVLDLSARLAAARQLCATLAPHAEERSVLSGEQRARLAVIAAERGNTIADLIDEAVSTWLATEAPARPQLRQAA